MSMIPKSCRLFGKDHAASKSMNPKSCRLFGKDHAASKSMIPNRRSAWQKAADSSEKDHVATNDWSRMTAQLEVILLQDLRIFEGGSP
jgi:hypothetical protein